MFSKLSLLALLAPLVSGLVLQIPEKPTSGGQITIHWTNEQGDPDTWSFELINTAFNNAFAIANNVNPAANSLTLTLPIVPVGDGYTLEAVNIGNIGDVFASTGSFAVGATTTTTTSTTAVSTTSSTTGTGTGTKSTAASITGTTTTPSVTPGFTSVINSATTPSATNTNTASVTTANGAATTSTSAALSTRFSLGFAAVLIPAMAGVMLA